MKSEIKKWIFILIMLFLLTGCSISTQNETSIEDKTKAELTYIEDSIFNIVNKYAKGEYLKDDVLDWESILDDEKKINDTLDTIILDLSELDINQEDILKLSSEVNNLIITTSAQNEAELLTRLNNIYTLIPKYLDKFWNNKNDVQDKELKSLVLASYSLANNGNWVEAKTSMQSAIDKYNGMMNSVEYMQENSYQLNKRYVLLGEIKNAIDLENNNLVKLKFINFIEKF